MEKFHLASWFCFTAVTIRAIGGAWNIYSARGEHEPVVNYVRHGPHLPSQPQTDIVHNLRWDASVSWPPCHPSRRNILHSIIFLFRFVYVCFMRRGVEGSNLFFFVWWEVQRPCNALGCSFYPVQFSKVDPFSYHIWYRLEIQQRTNIRQLEWKVFFLSRRSSSQKVFRWHRWEPKWLGTINFNTVFSLLRDDISWHVYFSEFRNDGARHFRYHGST